LGLSCVVLSGCPHHNQYELQLTPAGNSLERDLTCSRVPEKEPFPADQLAAVEQVYGQPPTLDYDGDDGPRDSTRQKHVRKLDHYDHYNIPAILASRGNTW
jgi:hypothetical protein